VTLQMRRLWLGVAVAIVSVASCGCGGLGKGVLAVPGDCTASDATLSFPPVAGFTATARIRADNCLDGSNYLAKSGTSVIVGDPFTNSSESGVTADSTIKVWLYVTFEFDNGEDLVRSPDVTITVPAAIVVPGRTFHLASDDTQFPTYFWLTSTYGTPLVQGTTFAFGGNSMPAGIKARVTYQFALYSTGT
jgi:hypothetical protein